MPEDDYGNYQNLPVDMTAQEAVGPLTAAAPPPASTPVDAAYIANLEEAMRRAYANAASKSFGARGELSSALDRIDPSTDLTYTPAAAQYVKDAGEYLANQTTGYDLSPLNLAASDRGTGAPMPYTGSQLEGFAASGPLENQFYANILPENASEDWDVGNFRFLPDQQYRLVDRDTGKVISSGTGYDAGKTITEAANDLFNQSGNKANFAVEQLSPTGAWNKTAFHDPEINGFTTFLKLALPMVTAGLAGPLGLGGVLGTGGAVTSGIGAALGSAAAGAAAGDSFGDILKSAALSGLGSYAGGELLGKLGASSGVSSGVSPGGAALNLDPNIINVVGNVLPVGSMLGAAGGSLANVVGAQQPDPNLVPGVDPITVTGGQFGTAGGGALGALGSSALAGINTQAVVDAAQQQAQQQAQQEADPDEIVVTGRPSEAILPALTEAQPGAVLPLNAPSLYNPVTDTPPAVEELQKQYANDYPDPNEIIVAGKPGGDLGALGSLVAPTLVSSPGALAETAADLQQQYEADPNAIVVTGAKPTFPVAPVAPNLSTPVAGTQTPAAEGPQKSTLEKIADYLQLGSLGLGLGSTLLGGGGGSGELAKIPGGFGSGSRNPVYSAKLPTPGQGGSFVVGGLGGIGTGGTGAGGIGGVTPPGGDYTKFGMGQQPAGGVTMNDIPQYGGVNPAGFNPQTWEWLGPQSTNARLLDLAALPQRAQGFAARPDQYLKRMAEGGYAVGGPGDGREDKIPAMLSDGEYVIDAETVALLGNGSNKAGAQQLDKFRATIRKHKGRDLARGKFSVNAKRPEAYLSGGR